MDNINSPSHLSSGITSDLHSCSISASASSSMPMSGQSPTSLCSRICDSYARNDELLELDGLFDHTEIERNAARFLSSLSNTSSLVSSPLAFEDSETLRAPVSPVFESFGNGALKTHGHGHLMRGSNSRFVAPYTTQSQHLLARPEAVYSNCTMDQQRMMAQHNFAQPAFPPPRFFPNNGHSFTDNGYLRQSFRPAVSPSAGAVCFPGKSPLPYAFQTPISHGYPYSNQQMPSYLTSGLYAPPSNRQVSSSSLSIGHARSGLPVSMSNSHVRSHDRLDAFLKPKPPHSRDIVVKYFCFFTVFSLQSF